ncbi:MAG: beta-ketoacyl-[acyl-carrier-protein] synthase II, partial [Chloroflexota bacterium]
MAKNTNRVVITGMGVASPLGLSVEAHWRSLLAGTSGIMGFEDQFEPETKVRMGGYIKDYLPEGHFSRKEARRNSRSSQLGLIAAQEAIKQAGISEQSVNKKEIGTIVGSSIGGFSAADPFFKNFYQSSTTSPLVIPKSMNSGPASNISITHGFKGPLMAVDAACATAAQSIGYAYNMIRFGKLEVAVTGGADSPFTAGVMTAWESIRALSTRYDTPETACRPFSA